MRTRCGERREVDLLEVERVEPVLRDRWKVLAVQGYLLRMAGDLAEAAEAYARAAERCPSTLERDHLVRQAALARAAGSAARVNEG